MTNTYAQYQQLQPIQTDFGQMSMQALDLYQRRQMAEQQQLAQQRQKDIELMKKIADYDSKFKVEDVQYHFNDEMMKVHSEAQKELYDIHKQKTLMESSGSINSPEYRSLLAREQSIMSTPKVLEQTFKVFDTYMKDLYGNMGKNGGYDDYLNAESYQKLKEIMGGKGWTYNYQTGTFDVTDPSTGEVKNLTPGQFQRNPLIFSSPERYVDVESEIDKYVKFIGAESQSYTTKDGSQITISKSKANDVANRKIIFDWLDTAIEDNSGFARKVAGTKDMTKTQLIEYIMNGAGIRQSTSDASYKRRESGGGYATKEEYYSQRKDVVSNPMTVFSDGDAYPAEATGYDWVPIRRSTGINIQPRQIVILSGETPDITFQTGKEKETVQSFKITDVTTGVDKFVPSGIQKMNVYNGDEIYSITYTDKDKEITKEITKGSVIPSDLSEKENLTVNKITKMPWYRRDVRELSSLEAINNASDTVPMVVGSFNFGGQAVHSGIPINDVNERAISNLNEETKKEKAFRDTGMISDYMSRFGSSEKYTPSQDNVQDDVAQMYVVDGTVYNIPAEEVEEFLQQFPNAKKQ